MKFRIIDIESQKIFSEGAVFSLALNLDLPDAVFEFGLVRVLRGGAPPLCGQRKLREGFV